MCVMQFNAIKSTIRSTKLIYNDPNGDTKEYDFPAKSKFKAKAVDGGFVFTKDSKVVTPVLKSATQDGNSFCCISTNDTHIDIEYELGYITPEYYIMNGDKIVAVDGKMYTISPTKSTVFSGHTVALDKNNKPITMGSGDNQVFVCKVTDTEYDVIDNRFKQILPFSLKTPDIKRTYIHTNKLDYLAIYEYDGSQYIGDNEGLLHRKYPTPMVVNSVIPFDGSDKYLYLTLLDEGIKMTTILEYDIIENMITNETMIRGSLNSIHFYGDTTLYITTHADGLMGVITGGGTQLIPHKFTNIHREKLRFNPSTPYKELNDYVFCVSVGQKQGVISYNGELLLNPAYKEIDFDESGKMLNGLYKFMVRENGLWGVVNSMGKVEVPFEYNHDPLSKIIVDQKNPQNPRQPIRRVKLTSKDGKTVYFNIFEPNIAAITRENTSPAPRQSQAPIRGSAPANTPLWMLANSRPPGDNKWEGSVDPDR